MAVPAVIIAGTHSGSGKTTVTLAVLAALRRRGLRIQGFKVGPDFIDAGHQSRVTGRPSRNLDTWLLDPPSLASAYRRGARGAELAVVEGVMGLFDGRSGVDEAGSTADLARRWGLPVVLVVDARGLARSIAPLVLGFSHFDESVRVSAVIANRVGGHRHYDDYLVPALRSSPTAPPAIGYLERNPALTIPSRHLGLVTVEELSAESRLTAALADAAEATLDLDQLIAIAREPALPDEAPGPDRADAPRVAARVAVARDRAFCFYYEENLERLREAGGELVDFSPLDDERIPGNVDLLYLGGGYPEVHAAELAANDPMRESIRRFHAEGGAILAECGGMMACAQVLCDHEGRDHRLWGLIPARTVMHPRLTALGYVTVRAGRDCLLGPEGTRVRGHEFHYSELERLAPVSYATHLERPDREPKPDGIQLGGLLAGYAHMHFGSNAQVAVNLLACAKGRHPR